MARNYSSGYVYKHRGFWHACISWRDGQGKQRRLTKSIKVRCGKDRDDPRTGEKVTDNRGKTMAETVLRQWRDELVSSEAAKGPSPSSSTLPVSEYVEKYIETKAAVGNVRDVTIKGYRSHLHKLLGTELGSTMIRDVRAAQIEEWEKSLASDGTSSTTMSHIHVFLKQVFEKARRTGDIPENPFELVEAPRRDRRPVNTLTPNEVQKMNRALEALGAGPFATAVKIAVKTGMRQGEICALRYRDVDFDSQTIRVGSALTRCSGRYELSSPKTSSSIRTIPFGGSLKETRLARKELIIRERTALGMAWDDSLFVIGSSMEGTWKSPQVLGKEWHAFARVAGLVGTQGIVPKFHDLRHTFATGRHLIRGRRPQRRGSHGPLGPGDDPPDVLRRARGEQARGDVPTRRNPVAPSRAERAGDVRAAPRRDEAVAHMRRRTERSAEPRAKKARGKGRQPRSAAELGCSRNVGPFALPDISPPCIRASF